MHSLTCQAALRVAFDDERLVVHGSAALARYWDFCDTPRDLDMFFFVDDGHEHNARLLEQLAFKVQQVQEEHGGVDGGLTWSVSMVRGKLLLLQMRANGRKLLDVVLLAASGEEKTECRRVEVTLSAFKKASGVVRVLSLEAIRARMQATVEGLSCAGMPALVPESNMYGVARAAKRLVLLHVLQEAGLLQHDPQPWTVGEACEFEQCKSRLAGMEQWRVPWSGAVPPASRAVLQQAFDHMQEWMRGHEARVAARVQEVTKRMQGYARSVVRSGARRRKDALAKQRKQHKASLEVLGRQVRDLEAQLEACKRRVRELETQAAHSAHRASEAYANLDLQRALALDASTQAQVDRAKVDRVRRWVSEMQSGVAKVVQQCRTEMHDMVLFQDIDKCDGARESAFARLMEVATPLVHVDVDHPRSVADVCLMVMRKAVAKAYPQLTAMIQPGAHALTDYMHSVREVDFQLAPIVLGIANAGLAAGFVQHREVHMRRALEDMQRLVHTLVQRLRDALDGCSVESMH
jgi:hypothetical protein